jgi:HlyD family secretion protein
MSLDHALRSHLPWSRTAQAQAEQDQPPRPAAPRDKEDPAKRRPPRLRPFLGFVALLAAAVVVGTLYHRSVAARALPDGLLQLNGRIEGDDVTLASKVPGRLQALLAREGDSIHAGQTIASLDDGVARARLAQATASRDAAIAKADAARADLVLLRKQVPIAVDSADATVRATDASLEQARAQEAQAGREQARVATLLASGSLDAQSNERAILAHDTALQAVAAARAARDRAATAAREARLGPDQIRAREAEIAALDAAARQAQGLVDEAQTALDDLTIKAPIDGTITTRFVDVGQVVSAGTPIVVIVDLDRLYLEAFVPETDVGRIHVGSPARVYTDAFPDSPAGATVRYVASRAEFTPKEVQTRDERVKLVYTVKLYVDDNHDRRLVPGLAADAMVRWREDAPWTTPR